MEKLGWLGQMQLAEQTAQFKNTGLDSLQANIYHFTGLNKALSTQKSQFLQRCDRSNH